MRIPSHLCQIGLAIGVWALGLAAPAAARAETVLVFAASSLQEALGEVVELWEGASVTVSYAGSAALARQIEAGAPADLFLSANADWIRHLEARGLTDPAATRALLSNRLVVAAPAGGVQPGADFEGALAALPDQARIATGFLQAVPAGIYARQALEGAGLLETWQRRIVQTENVRLALALAARGEVARALVYETDVLAEPELAIEAVIPADLHDPIRYPVTRLRASSHPDALAFFTFLGSEEAAAVFRSYGFEVLE